MRKLLIGCALVLSVAACGESIPPLEAGTVTDKRHYDEVTNYIPVYTFNDKGVITGFYVEEEYHPEEWILDIRDGDRTGVMSVGPQTWNLFQEGMPYP